MYTVRRSGSSSHPNCAPFSIHSRILALSSDRWSKGDISSTTKSRHRCGNLRFSLLVSLSTRERRTQEASGEYAAPLGRKYSRSEERRVGKEGRSRWSPYHEKKRKNAMWSPGRHLYTNAGTRHRWWTTCTS